MPASLRPGGDDRPLIAYVVEPRFPGGTSAAVASELAVAAQLGRVVVHARRSAMFGESRHVAPPLRAALDALRLPLVWDAPEIAADVAILHNPAFLKHQPAFGGRIVARHLIVVSHEKFPPLADLDRCFPPHAEANVILGADMLIASGLARPHWTLLPFRSVEVEAFMGMIDFLVYFTAPTWRESFGRVIAEAMAAGKVVLTDPETAAPFGAGVVACRPHEVDAAIARHLAASGLYAAQAARGQRALDACSAAVFAGRLAAVLAAGLAPAALSEPAR